MRDIPVHSVMLMNTREEALAYPKRDLRLGFCPHCEFVTNTIFDSAAHEYSVNCEETQGYSPTFNRFSEKLAKYWVDEYDLKNKTVLEVGCGKGEFLGELVRFGLGKGIGIDPAYVPGRLDEELLQRLEFIPELYSEEYAHLSADAVCCRHTLEHVGPTLEFLTMLRRSIGRGSGVTLLFDLPDAYRVFEEPAYWDVYYEHCSYFTARSLRRLFEMAGFGKIKALYRDYDDQFLVIEAIEGSPESESAKAVFDIENESIAALVEGFAEKVGKTTDAWVQRVQSMKRSGGTVVLWGGGSKAVAFLAATGLKQEIDAVVDINPHKWNRYLPGSGHEVVGPDDLVDLAPNHVVLMNPIYKAEVREMLKAKGLNPEVHPL